MEAKKNPSKDVHRMRGVFFQISLIVSVALVSTAFEWRTEIDEVSFRNTNDMDDIDVLPVIPVTNLIDPPLPSPIKSEIISPKYLNPTQITEVSNNSSTASDEPNINQESTPFTNVRFEPVKDTLEDYELPFVIVQNPATPVGGFDSFYKTLAKALKYPRQATRMGTEGRVFVEFVVNRDGSASELKVVRGIGAGCDEEAIRALSLTKWNPAKQRGKPVRQKMVLAVLFQLH